MPGNLVRIGAIIGSALIALLLKGSSAGSSTVVATPPDFASRILHANSAYRSGDFQSARALFQSIATEAHDAGLERTAAMNWNNAGGCSLALMQYGAALSAFMRAREIAQSSGQTPALASTLNNMANLYLHTGQPENALSVAKEGLELPSARVAPDVRPKTRFQLANALSQLNRLAEAEPIYLLSINESLDQGDVETASRVLGLFGMELVRARRFDEADWVLGEAFRLARMRHLAGVGAILRTLAQLRGEQGDAKSAAVLFDAALAAPPGINPRWGIFLDRGQFRLKQGDLEGALADFREARGIAYRVRADVVPADRDRVGIDDGVGGLGGVLEGLVDAGNRLAEKTGDTDLPRETFDAAEQDRLWSLRKLVPATNDWRARLPEHYWQLLARYQSLERAALNGQTAALRDKGAPLQIEMQQIEAAAAGPSELTSGMGASPLANVQNTLDDDSVLLSFHVTRGSSWMWAVDRTHTGVFPLPSQDALTADVAEFTAALKAGRTTSPFGQKLYSSLFGGVPGAWLAHRHWLLEADGPLYDLPFAALVTGDDAQGQPVYLIEKAALQSIPSALLIEHGSIDPTGSFLGVGDPVYNRADPRFEGRRGQSELTLPRLPNTMRELEACSRAWTPGRSRLLQGNQARLESVEEALKANPAIIHFATHVVGAPGEFRSGLIALSLGADGAMGLLGTGEIVARPVAGSLVVMDGCHSSRGQALPGAGLMGLTRAWIGAGARAVMATEWEIPDEAAQSIMTDFYRSLRESPQAGLAFALRHAQISEIQRGNGRQFPGKWAGYFLLSRI